MYDLISTMYARILFCGMHTKIRYITYLDLITYCHMNLWEFDFGSV